jgi:hypothetical protein
MGTIITLIFFGVVFYIFFSAIKGSFTTRRKINDLRNQISQNQGNFTNGDMNNTFVNEDMNNEDMEEMQRQQHQQFVDWSMQESMKSVTPVEHGGYDMNQGNSFNDPGMGGF